MDIFLRSNVIVTLLAGKFIEDNKFFSFELCVVFGGKLTNENETFIKSTCWDPSKTHACILIVGRRGSHFESNKTHELLLKPESTLFECFGNSKFVKNVLKLHGPFKAEEMKEGNIPAGMHLPVSDGEFMVQQFSEVRYVSDALAHRLRNQVGTNECYVTESAARIGWEFLKAFRDSEGESIVRSFFFNEYCFRLFMNIDQDQGISDLSLFTNLKDSQYLVSYYPHFKRS